MAATTKIPRLRPRDALRLLRAQTPKTTGKGTLKCYYKPARKAERTWDAKSAARAVCAAVNAGVPPAEIRSAMFECVPCAEGRRRAQQQVQAMQAIEGSNQTLAVADAALQAFQLVARWVGRVARFVPQARAAGLILGGIEGRLGAVRGEILAARAANDVALRTLRLAA
jgi:hypothetical protein